ncbi:MAG: hypothetical protein NTU47_05370 [Ignavibacteriales bacterium]|nr:hypothetical protein [Ignavibacteriales bacterium]
MTQPAGSDSHNPVPPVHPTQPQEQQEPQAPYEFTPAQNDIIRVLARKMKFVGVFYIIASCFVALAGVVAFFFSPLVGLFYLVLVTPELLIGIWTIHAAHSFRLVIDTKGRDIPHLMDALTDLRKLYTLMFWLLVAGFVFVLLAIAAGILLYTMGIIPGTTDNSTFTALII